MIKELLMDARASNASDVHISEGFPLYFRINGVLQQVRSLSAESSVKCIKELIPEYYQDKAYTDLDFAYEDSDGRYRVNVFHHAGKLGATIRLLSEEIPTLEELKLPKVLAELANKQRGLILITGPTGSGKSTTLASMIEWMNQHNKDHIITIEDPIEYVYTQKRCLIHQREVGQDVESFALALKSALREDPDVILVGEMRDYETISAALTAAETGHLVLATLHTTSASSTIDRIIDACPGEVQNQVRTQLSTVLQGIVTQCLIPTADGKGRVCATEIVVNTPSVANVIRENKCYQLPSIMQSSAAYGMHTLNADLVKLVNSGLILPIMAYKYTNDEKDLEQIF